MPTMSNDFELLLHEFLDHCKDEKETNKNRMTDQIPFILIYYHRKSINLMMKIHTSYCHFKRCPFSIR